MNDNSSGPIPVTFRVPSDVHASTIELCGDFNGWSPHGSAMHRCDDGSFQLTLLLTPGRRYRYRYFVDGSRWENDRNAQDYAPNPFGGFDSVVDVAAAVDIGSLSALNTTR